MKSNSFITKSRLKPIGPYVSGRRVDNLFFLSGMIGIDENSQVPENFSQQAHLAVDSLNELTHELGRSMDHVVKITVFLTDMDCYGEMNRIMQEKFSETHPARSAIGVLSLPRHAKIEIEAIIDMS